MRACVCGHSREHHAWGVGECATVVPEWACERKCMAYRERNDEQGVG